MKIDLQQNDDISRIIRKKIIQKSKLVVVGFYAFDYYVKKESTNYVLNKFPYYEVISSNLERDTNRIYKLLKKNDIVMKKFNPFFSFIDERVEFYYKDQLVLVLYGNNQRCTVYNYSIKKKTYFGTYNLVFMYLLFNYFYCYINHNKFGTVLLSLIGKLYETRKKYLTERKITVIDKSPFQDFTFKCFGIAYDTIRESRIRGIEKKKLGKQMKFRYSASGKPGKVPEFRFNNTSGNIKK